MEPLIVINGDTSRASARSTAQPRFNGAVDRDQRRLAPALARSAHASARFNGAVDRDQRRPRRLLHRERAGDHASMEPLIVINGDHPCDVGGRLEHLELQWSR